MTIAAKRYLLNISHQTERDELKCPNKELNEAAGRRN